MRDSFSFLEHPAVHPRLLKPGGEPWAAAASWVLEDVLCPGLPTEIYHNLWQMPLDARPFDDGDLRGMSWRCGFQLPPEPDPQHAESFYRLQRFLDQDLPELVGRGLGRKMVRSRPGLTELMVLRKGSFLEATAPSEGHRGFLLSLSVGDWPVEWGGHLETRDAVRSPGWNRLHLFEGGLRIPVLERHVEILSIHGWLEPCA